VLTGSLVQYPVLTRLCKTFYALYFVFIMPTSSVPFLSRIKGANDPTDRKWEDLPINCLVSVFEKVDLASRTLGVPFVCKSWFEASIEPGCWKVLDLRDTDIFESGSHFVKGFKCRYGVNNFSLRGFLKFLIRRSNKLATKLFIGNGRLYLTEVVLLWGRYVKKLCLYLTDEKTD
jgi:hypothetical protein